MTTIRRSLGTIAVVGLTLVAAAAQGSPLVQDGTLTVCTDATYPPLEFYAKPGDAEPVGFDVDIAKAVGDAMGARVRILNVAFTGLLPSLTAGRCALVISGLTITPERTQAFAAVPYMQYRKVLMVPANRDFKSIDDLSGETIAFQSGSIFEGDAAHINKQLASKGKEPVMVQKYPNGTDLLQQLMNGRVAATITFDNDANWQASINPGKFKVAFPLSEPVVSGIFMQKDDANVAAVREAMKKVISSGKYEEIKNRWKMPDIVGDIDING